MRKSGKRSGVCRKRNNKNAVSLGVLIIFMVVLSAQTVAGTQTVCYGDSLTNSWIPGFCGIYPDALNESLSDYYTESQEVIEEGHGGRTSIDGANNVSKLIEYYPDMDRVCLMFGTNDAYYNISTSDFKSNMTYMIDAFQNESIDVILGILPPVGGILVPECAEYEPQRIRVLVLNEILRELALENEVYIADNSYYFGDAWSSTLYRYGTDCVHPNRAGYEIFGNTSFFLPIVDSHRLHNGYNLLSTNTIVENDSVSEINVTATTWDMGRVNISRVNITVYTYNTTQFTFFVNGTTNITLNMTDGLFDILPLTEYYVYRGGFLDQIVNSTLEGYLTFLVNLSNSPHIIDVYAPCAPNAISRWNNKTNDDSLAFTINTSEGVKFGIVYNQTGNITWTASDVASRQNTSVRSANQTYNWSVTGTKYVNVSMTNIYGTSNTTQWNITVQAQPTAPLISNVTNSTPTSSQVWINWSTNQSDSRNRVMYSKNADLSSASWSDWYNNTNSVNISLTSLDPANKYYYSAYSYNGTDDSVYSNSSVYNFTTVADTTPPIIKNETINATEILVNETVKLNATVTDKESTVTSVKFRIKYPNGIEINYSASEVSTDNWEYNFSNTTQRGSYNWTYTYATSSGGTNNTITAKTFNASDIPGIIVIINNPNPARPNVVNIKAHLINSSGSGINGQNITFKNGTTLIGYNITNATGWTQVNWSISSSELLGNHTINVSYSGNISDFYKARYNNSNKVTVWAPAKIPLVLINNSNPASGEYVRIDAKLEYDNTTALSNQTITFKNNSDTIGTDITITNESGWSTITWNTSGCSGSYRINVTYSGNSSLYTLSAFNDSESVDVHPPSGAPNATSWWNNKTNDDSLTFTINTGEGVEFGIEYNQTGNITWTASDVASRQNTSVRSANQTYNWSVSGTRYVNVSMTNINGTSNIIQWNITVQAPPTAPLISNVTNSTPTTSQVWINWTTNQSDSSNRVKYSKNADLSSASWSDWDNNTNSVNISLTSLDPANKYYYSAYSYNGTDDSVYSNSSVYNFTTVAPVLSYSPTSHNFGDKCEGETGSTTFEIWNSGTGTLTYSLSEICGWVDVHPTSGSSTGEHDTITVDIDTTGLSEGSHTCDVSISSNGGSGMFNVTVNVVPCENEVYLDPQHSMAMFCNTTEVQIWANATEFRGGQINLTYDPTCANVTNWVRNTTNFLMGGWSHYDGREWINFSTMDPQPPSLTGDYMVGTLTIHCVNDSKEGCETPLAFIEGSELKDDMGKPVPATWIDGTFECIPGLCGDVAPYPDCDGKVDMGDVILLLNNVSYPENQRYVLCNEWAGDCRCTGVRDMGDVILLLNNVSYPENQRYVLDCC